MSERFEMEPEKCIPCTKGHNNSVGSQYPRGSVPEHLFRKNPEDPKSALFKTCIHCRTYHKKAGRRHLDKHKELASAQEDTNDKSEFRYCLRSGHGTLSKSPHPQHKVPIALFRKEANNPKSKLHKWCSDCRSDKVGRDNKKNAEKKEVAESKGLHYCFVCQREIKHEERYKNLDGSLGSTCISCGERSNRHTIEFRQTYNRIKREVIEKNQASCSKCKCLYFNPVGDSISAVKLETYLHVDGDRHVTYNNVSYTVIEFLSQTKQYLELSVIDFDHMTEDEQRGSGLLSEDEVFIGKRKLISKVHSEHEMKLELLKCRPLCVKCHVEETMRREDEQRAELGKGKSEKTKKNLLKLAYVNNLKLAGCVACGFKDRRLPRFFHLDHIDPSSKIEGISKMVTTAACTLNDLKEEIAKCRILCGHCHRIHTTKQRKEGLFIKREKSVSE